MGTLLINFRSQIGLRANRCWRTENFRIYMNLLLYWALWQLRCYAPHLCQNGMFPHLQWILKITPFYWKQFRVLNTVNDPKISSRHDGRLCIFTLKGIQICNINSPLFSTPRTLDSFKIFSLVRKSYLKSFARY